MTTRASATGTMGKLSTHILDTANGKPAAQIPITLWAIDAHGAATRVLDTVSNADGRTDAPLLEGAALRRGRYRLTFATAAWFRACGTPLADPPFLDQVQIDFAIADPAANYHVPLLVSPWSFSTYRGS